MNRAGKATEKKRDQSSVFAVALTWDGARWPVKKLAPKARAFLIKTWRTTAIPSSRKMADLFRDDQVREIRICWVPRLKGGNDVLSEPFQIPSGVRIGFQSVKTVPLGDVLGVVYRRK
jgi:hypothetical protein